jgi:hypothetical protein
MAKEKIEIAVRNGHFRLIICIYLYISILRLEMETRALYKLLFNKVQN